MDVNDHVDAVHERTTNPTLVSRHASRCARAFLGVVAKVPAGTGVSRRHKLEVAREDVHTIDPHDSDLAVLKRLAQGLQRVCRKLRQLVQEEHSSVSQRDLSGHDRPAASNETANRDRMVGSPERTLPSLQGSYGLAGYRVDEHRLGPLRISKRRHPASKHSLSRTRWPYHEHAMASRSGNDHGTLWDVLVDNVREVEVAGDIATIHVIGTPSCGKERQLADASL